jgi:hypothetical protein
VWIPAPHVVEYLDRHGVVHSESAHLARRTLIWQVGSVTLRLEGGFTREQALAVAGSTIPGQAGAHASGSRSTSSASTIR